MDSMPPATITSLLPAARRSWASMVAFIPEPHTLLMVVQPADSGRPALRAAWRAGAWPMPAGSTQPIRTSSTCSGRRPARSTAAWMATPPSCGAVRLAKSPWKPPMGVRAAETMTTGSLVLMAGLSGIRWIETEGELLGSHANGPVETDHLAIEVGVPHDVRHQGGELLRFAQTGGERNHLPEGILHVGGHPQEHGRLHNPRGDGHDPDAMAGQFAGNRQGHGHHSALGGGIGGLAELAVEGRYGGGADDHSALAAGVGFVPAHDLGRQPDHVEAAHQVDLQGAGEALQAVGTLLAEHLFRRRHAGAIDQAVEAAEGFNGSSHCRLAAGRVGHVRGDEAGSWAQFLGHLRAGLSIHVGQDHPPAALYQPAGGGCSEPGTGAGHRSEERRVGKECRSRWSPYH